jgi:hypothetical protein
MVRGTAAQQKAAAARQARADKKQHDEDEKQRMLEEEVAAAAGLIAEAGLSVSDDESPDLNTQEELADEPMPSAPEAPAAAATPRRTTAIPSDMMAHDAWVRVESHLDDLFGKGLPASSFVIDLVEGTLNKLFATGSGSWARYASAGAFDLDPNAPLLRPASRAEYITYLVNYWFRSRVIDPETRAPAPAPVPAALPLQGGEPATAGDAGVAARLPPVGAIVRDAMDEQEDQPRDRRAQSVRVRFLSHPYSCLSALMRS